MQYGYPRHAGETGGNKKEIVSLADDIGIRVIRKNDGIPVPPVTEVRIPGLGRQGHEK
jgi:hypothetical protein